MQSLRSGTLACAGVVVGGALLRLGFGPGYLGYDASWTMVWASQLTAGGVPSYEEPSAPTPHPLAIIAALPAAAVGGRGDALVAVSFVAFAALLAGLVALGARLGSWPAGVLAAAVIATRGIVLDATLFASVDLPFLACIVWAAALEAGRPRRGLPVLAVLFAAGLLRPEAWLLSVAYVAWLATGTPRRHLVGAALLAVAAPVVWAAGDLAVTGDALHSLRHTRFLAGELNRPTGLGTAITELPGALRRALGDLPLVAGLVGAVAALVLAPRSAWLPASIVAGGVLGWFVLGAAQLPLLTRYQLVAACMLATLAGIGAALPWLARRTRWLAYVVAAVVLVLLVAAVPDTVDGVAAVRRSAGARERVHQDLRSLAAAPAVRAAASRCGRVVAPDVRARPLLALDLGVDVRRVGVGSGPPGLVVTYGSREAARVFRFPSHRERAPRVPPGAAVIARNRSWLAYAVCS